MVFLGVDWAEEHHDAWLENEQGEMLGKARIANDVGGVRQLHELVAEHAHDPGQVVVGIETDRGLLVAALVGAGYQIYAVNPLSVSRYRDRPGPRAPSRIGPTPNCWPTWCAPIATTIDRWPATL